METVVVNLTEQEARALLQMIDLAVEASLRGQIISVSPTITTAAQIDAAYAAIVP